MFLQLVFDSPETEVSVTANFLQRLILFWQNMHTCLLCHWCMKF